MRILIWLFGIGVTVAFVTTDPGQTISWTTAQTHLLALVTTLAWSAAALGAGGALLRRMAPAILDTPTGWAHALISGLLLWGLGGLVLGALGLLHTPGIVVLFVLMAAGWLVRPRLSLPTLGLVAPVVGAAILGPLLLVALAPPTGTDALYYHLGVPLQMLMDGELVGGLLHPQGSRPMILHLPYAALIHGGGLTAPAIFHLLLSGALLALVVQVGEQHLGKRSAGAAAALLLLGSWTFMSEAGRAGNDVITGLAVLVALDAALRGNGRALALAAGTAWSLKYTATGPLIGIFLVAQLPWRGRILSGLGAVACVLPWWGRNLIEGMHPFFPFVGWPETSVPMAFQYMDKYGAGRGPVDFLLLPWRVMMEAEIDSFRFMGRLNPALMVLAPFGLWAAIKGGPARRIAIVALAGASGWAFGPHWLRYLLPTLPLLALAAAAGLSVGRPRALGAAALLAGLVGVPANWLEISESVADRIQVVSGQESPEKFLSREVRGFGAIAWANAHLPADAQVALLFSWSSAHLNRRQVLGSVEDHVPTRHWILHHPDRAIAALVEAGVTHAMVRRARFLPKAYPFLDPGVVDAQLQAPVRELEEQLLMKANLIHQDGPVRVYRLPSASPGP